VYREVDPTFRELARTIGKVALAFHALHAAGVRHRDVKPAHILIRESDGEPVLIDFGIGARRRPTGFRYSEQLRHAHMARVWGRGAVEGEGGTSLGDMVGGNHSAAPEGEANACPPLRW
jgi:serine/threonine protein kinase